MKKFAILALLVVLAAIVIACAAPTPEPTKAPPPPPPTTAPQPTPAPKPTEAPKPAALDGAALLTERCTTCHNLDRVKSAAKNKDQWTTTVDRMIGKGAKLTDAEKGVLLDYLAKTYPAAAAPAPTTAPATARLKCANPIKVGFITDKSGPLASYGAMMERSFLLGWEYIAGAPGKDNVFKVEDCEIQIIVADDKGVVDTTATVARELIEVKKVDLLVGTVSSGGTATLQGIARDNKKVLVVAPAASNDITGKDFNEYTFRTSRNNYQDAINLCQHLTTQYKKFVQIAPDYAFGRGGAAAFRDSCNVLGGTFVLDDIFAPLDTKEFTPYLDKVLKSGADAWIVTWAGAGFVPMFKTASEMGVFDKMKLAASVADNATVPLYAAALGQNSGILYHYTSPKNKINDWLVEQVKARHKVPPDLFDADAMNAAFAVVTALRKTNGSTDSATLIKAMEGMEFDGPKGKVVFRPEDHVAIQDMYIVKILNVTDKDFKFFETVKTNRPEPPCLLPENLKARCGKLPFGSLSAK